MKEYSIKFVIILSFCMAIILFVAYLLCSNLYAMHAMRIKTTDNIETAINIIGRKNDQRMGRIEQYVVEKSISGDVISLLMMASKNVQFYLEANEIRNEINKDIKLEPLIGMLFICFDNLDQIIMSGNQNTASQDELTQLIHQYINRTSTEIWQAVEYQGEKHLMIVYYNELGAYTGAMVYADEILNEWESLNVIGVEKAQYMTEANSSFISSINIMSDSDEIFKKASKDFSADSHETMNWYGNYLAVRYSMAIGDFQTYIVIDTQYIMKTYNDLWILLLVIPLLALVAFAVYYYVVNILLLKPLRGTFDNMYITMKKEDILLPDIQRFSEVNRVVKMFNVIIESIQNLKISLYEKQLENERTKMKMLQSQINPHMFMNSLAIINSMSQMKTEESLQVVRELTKYLSAYFRFILDSKEDFVDINAEIKNTETYLEIQRIRYPDAFDFCITETGCEGISVPPLILQPLIENSIKHGFKVTEKMMVYVDCSVDGEMMTIKIRDNGIGFSKESLEMICKKQDTDANQQIHFGIRNVETRLQLMYPLGATLRCFNDCGAVIEIKIKIRQGDVL